MTHHADFWTLIALIINEGFTPAGLRIEEWAKAVGVWIDDTDEVFSNAFGERIAEGGEAIYMIMAPHHIGCR